MIFKIKEARERVGLTQKELAESLGIKPTTFNGYEKGTHDPKSEVLKQIALKCKTSVDFLLGLSEQPRKIELQPKLDSHKQQLSNIYDSLNDKGKKKLLEYADDLINSGNYFNTVTVVEAARSQNNDEPVKVKQISQEDLDIFDIVPQSDEKL